MRGSQCQPYIRNNYAAARLQGLEEDLNLNGDQYQTGLSILFVGYVTSDSVSISASTDHDQVTS